MLNTAKRRSRLIAGLAVASAIALGVAACSSTPAVVPSASSSGKLSGAIRITFGTGSQQVPMDALVKAFEAKYPATTVTVNYLPNTTITQSILTELRAGNGPDVFYSNGGSGQPYSIQPLAKAGQLASFDDKWTTTLPTAAQPLYTYKKKVYGLPLAQVPVGIVYNIDAFKTDKIKVPTSIDQLTADCKTIAATGKSAISVAGAVGANAGVFGQAIAASYVYSKYPDWDAQRAAKKTTFASTPEWKQTLQVVQKLDKAGCFVPGIAGTQVPQMFAQAGSGAVLMVPGPAGVINAVKSVNASVNMGIMPFPGTQASSTRALVGFTDALAVNAKSKNLAVAKAFVNFVAEPTNARTYTSAVSAISIADSSKGVVPAGVEPFGPYLKADKSVSTPNLVWPNADVYTAFSTGIQGLFTGQQTPDQILTAMDAAWDE